MAANSHNVESIARFHQRGSRPEPVAFVPGAFVALFTILSLMTAGCLVVPPSPPARQQTQVPMRGSYSQATQPATTQPTGVDDWLAKFHDKELVSLVAEAIAKNPDLAQVAANYDEFQARVKLARAALLPQLNGTADTVRTNYLTNPKAIPGKTAYQYDMGLTVSWEVDLWGRLRAATKAAQQDAASAALDLAWARQSLAAEVAQAWFVAITARQQQAIAADLLQVEQTTLRITQSKVKVGRANKMDLNVAKANVAASQDEVEQSDLAYQNAARSLELLLGRYPATELKAADALPAFPGAFPVNVPSQLLERRPDVLAADRTVAAAFHRVQSAKAAQLPQVTLSGSYERFLDPQSYVWAIGANLLAPLFDGGSRLATVEITQAQQRAALAQYVQVGLKAFGEVETALAGLRILGEREAQLQKSTNELAQAADIAQKRYDAGQLSLLDLNQVQRQYYSNWSNLVKVQGERLQQAVNLYLSTGSQFEAPSSVSIHAEHKQP